MEVKKLIKKVAAFAAGATMVGATVLSAFAAADLSNFPAPFVKNGVYDALIVVGDNAAAADVVGAVDIGASLQYAMKTTSTVEACSGATATISNGVAIAKTGEDLNYNETLYSVRNTPLGADELPTILADGKYTESKGTNNNDVTYTQKLYLGSGTEAGKFSLLGYGVSPYPSDKDAAEYIYFANNQNNKMYQYRLDFDTAVLVDNSTSALAIADVKDSQIEIQGSKYTITGVKASSAGNQISELTMMAGDTLVWLTQDQKITKTLGGVSHEIQVIDVTESATACGVSVDGDVVWIDTGSSETINGVKIGVTDAKVIHAQLQDQDICQINIGSSELKLRGSTGKIQKDGTNLDNAYGYFTQTGGNWDGLNISFYPNDRTYLAAGESYNDPVFGRFKYVFAGLGNDDYENLKIDVTSDDRAEFTFVNYEGKDVTVPFYMNTTQSSGTPTVKLGQSITEPMLLPGETYTVATAGDQIGTMFYVVTSGAVAHVLKLDSIDVNNNKITLKDLTYDKTYSEKTYTPDVNTAIDLGSVGSITLNITGSNTITRYVSGPAAIDIAKSHNEAIVNVTPQWINSSVNGTGHYNAFVEITEKDDSSSAGFGSGLLTFNLNNVSGSSGSTQKIELGSISTNTMTGSDDLMSPVSEKYGDNDIKLGVSYHGTRIRYDNKDHKWVELAHPKSDVVANVFVAPVSAEVTSVAGDVTTTTLERINLGAARLASEVSDVAADNLIVVGGPCANDVAAELMGQSGATCATGFEEGKATIRLYEQSTGKVAMLVAGFSALDTRRATRVVAGYDQYSLSGTEVSVSGTSLTDINVGAPQ